MERTEILQTAANMLNCAERGDFTREQYASMRARLFQIDGAKDIAEELDRYLLAREKDRLDPFYGDVFPTEGRPPYVERAGNRLTLSPVKLARTVAARSHIVNLEGDDGSFVRYYYRDGAYAPCSDERLKERIKNEISSFDEAFCKMSVINETFALICSTAPAGKVTDLDADENVVNFQNCLLRLDTMEALPHSPAVLSTVRLHADWFASPPETPVFDAFISKLCGGDKAKKKLLMQFMGLCLTNVPGYRTKKALLMVGRGNTGKSVAKGMVERILGADNCAAVDLNDLEEDKFAASQLVGKRLAGTSDMRTTHIKELACFKRLTGGDRLYAQYKGKNPFSFQYRGLLWFCMNELPRFSGDRGDWVYDRMLLFPCDNEVDVSSRDPQLPEKLYAERDGIACRLVSAAAEVVKQHYRFSVPPELELRLMQYSLRNDPIKQFFTECCVIRKSPEIPPLDECTCKKIFEAFRLWCRDNNCGFVPKKSDFKNTVASLLCRTPEELIIKTKKNQYYVFELNEETMDELRGTLFIKKV